MQWILMIIQLASFAATSECLKRKRTNLAFTTPYPYSRSRRSKYVSELPSLPSSNQLSDYYLTPGKPSSYFIVEKYDVPSVGFPSSSLDLLFEEADVKRLNMTTINVTLPSALAMLDSDRYPDMKSSLKAARDGSILVQRQQQKQKQRGRSGDRIYPNDTIYRQEQLDIGASEYWHRRYNVPFMLGKNGEEDKALDVIYEDNHIAIVNKPGGMNLFDHESHSTISEDENHCNSVKDLLPYVAKPPADGTRNVLALPEPAHRLDKLTAGLLLVAKTRPALSNLSAQFRDRTIEKTYTAICYNIPKRNPNDTKNDGWQCIEEPLDGKWAITYWRVLKKFKHESVHLSLLELKPKTGRYRQLRRHMAKTKDCPLVGDAVFAKGIENQSGDVGEGVPMAKKLGLFLCSSSVRFNHPHYKISDLEKMGVRSPQTESKTGHKVTFVSEGDKVVINAFIELPKKFAALVDQRKHRA